MTKSEIGLFTAALRLVSGVLRTTPMIVTLLLLPRVATANDTLAIRAFYVENYSYGPLDQDAGSGYSLPPSNFAWRTNKTTHTIMFGGSGIGGTFTQTSPYWAAAGPTADSAALICGITGQPFWRWWRDSTHANGGYLIQSFQAVGSSNFDFVAGDSVRTETFWRSFIMWAIRNEVDGCDLDAESSNQTIANRTRFFRIGRRLGYNATWQSYIASTGKPGFRRNGKMIIGNALYMQSTDWMSSTADSTIDFFDLQAYNYQNMWGGSSNMPWYQTPWGVPAGQACGSCEPQGLNYGFSSHTNLIQEWVNAGWTRSKIVVGFDPGAVTVYTGTSILGIGTPLGVETDWARQDFERLTSFGGIRTYNPIAMAPYISGIAIGGGLIGPFVGSYTDSVSLKAICDELYSVGAGGIMVYAVAKDVATLGSVTNHALDYYRTPTISAGSYRAWQLNMATPAAPSSPSASTGTASLITQTTATFNGSVSANGASTTVRFVWGSSSGVYTDSALASQSPIGSGSAGVSLGVTGLTPATNYYYRVRAYNALGSAQGSEVTFRTALPGGQGLRDITAQGNPIALITIPTGEGNHDIEVIRDGVTPSVGSSDALEQYDTFTGDSTRSFDWIGFQFTGQRSFAGITYQEGLDNQWGGCFADLQVQVRSGGVWTDVPGIVVDPPYAGNNLISYETYTVSFAPVSGDAIRVAGTPTGSAHYIGVAELRMFELAATGDDNQEAGHPSRLQLYQNYPNPFNPTTNISFALPRDGYVSLKILDILGREIATLINEQQRAGLRSIEWNATGFASGVYLCRLQSGDVSETRKIVLVR